MLRLALRRAASSKPSISAVRTTRHFGSNGRDVVHPMIRYALGHARSQKSADSYGEAMLILEQGMANAPGVDPGEDEKALFLLAMSTLLYESGEVQDALEKLQMVHQLENASLDLRVAAYEGQIGLKLEDGQDAASSVLAHECSQLLDNSTEGSLPSLEVLKLRVKTAKGLVHILLGDLKSAESSFTGCESYDSEGGKDQTVNATLSYGEYLHSTGNFSSAKDTYEKLLQVLETKNVDDSSYLASTNMVPEEISLGATCALGQVLSHLGEFEDAEWKLTEALKKAEEHFGLAHPKVGVVLTCIATMLQRKAKMEASSSLVIQEGLYRRALDLLKAPAMDAEVPDMQAARRDMVAFARGGYAEILCIQKNRKSEGERMKNWASSVWKHSRLSLAQVLEFSEPSEAAVVDTRILRVL